MEPIKFRAKTNDDKIVFGYYYYNWRTKQHIIHCNSETGVLVDREFEIKPETLSRFSTVKDENNIEIYENDVVSMFSNTKSIVKFGYQDIGHDFQGIGFFTTEIGTNECFNFFGGKMIKVIGNIFDNPELLSE